MLLEVARRHDELEKLGGALHDDDQSRRHGGGALEARQIARSIALEISRQAPSADAEQGNRFLPLAKAAGALAIHFGSRNPPDWSKPVQHFREAEEAYNNGIQASHENQRADLQRGQALLRVQVGELAVQYQHQQLASELASELLHPSQDQPNDPPALKMWRARARISDRLEPDRRNPSHADEPTPTREAEALAADLRARGRHDEAAGTLLHIATKAAQRGDPHLEGTVTKMLSQAVVDARKDSDQYLEAMARYNLAVLPVLSGTGQPNWPEIHQAEEMLGQMGSASAADVHREAITASELFPGEVPQILTVRLPDLWYMRTSEVP